MNAENALLSAFLQTVSISDRFIVLPARNDHTLNNVMVTAFIMAVKYESNDFSAIDKAKSEERRKSCQPFENAFETA